MIFEKEEWRALLLSTLAGLSTTIGALFAIIKKPDNALLALLLGIAVGVMATLSFAEMYVHNAMKHGFIGTTIAFIVGAGFFYGVHPYFPDFESSKESPPSGDIRALISELEMGNSRDANGSGRGEIDDEEVLEMAAAEPSAAGIGLEVASSERQSDRSSREATTTQRQSPSPSHRESLLPTYFNSADSLPLAALRIQRPSPSSGRAPTARPSELMRLGLLMALTMTLHNLPEGFAVAFSAYTNFGVVMAVAIAVHNIPEGIIVAAPVYAATGSRWKALGIATASGLSEPIGALLALLVVKPFLTESTLQYILAFVGGIMLAVCVVELWPEAMRCRQNVRTGQGIFLGSFVMAATLWFGV